MSLFPLRCPSCDHGNPVGSNFCNQCGAPVYYEVCNHCEAINHRGADRCYKCGSPLSPESLSIPETIVALATGTESSRGWTASDQGAPGTEPRAHANDAIINESSSSAAGAQETSAPPRQPAEQDFDARAEHAETKTTRRRSPTLALAAVILVALAVPAYVAYEDPVRIRQAIQATTPTLDESSDVRSMSSPQPIPASALVAWPREPAPLLQDSQERPPEPAVDTSGAVELRADNTASGPPQGAGDSTPSTPGVSIAPPPQAAKTVRKSKAKSSASKSKQGSASAKPASRKPSDARAGAKAALPPRASASAPSAATTSPSRESRD